jgi:hypothetical protein
MFATIGLGGLFSQGSLQGQRIYNYLKESGKGVDKGRLEGTINKQPIPPLIDFFKHIEGPRIERNNVYPLLEVR